MQRIKQAGAEQLVMADTETYLTLLLLLACLFVHLLSCLLTVLPFWLFFYLLTCLDIYLLAYLYQKMI